MNLAQAVYLDEAGRPQWREQEVHPLATELERRPVDARVAFMVSRYSQGARHQSTKRRNDE